MRVFSKIRAGWLPAAVLSASVCLSGTSAEATSLPLLQAQGSASSAVDAPASALFSPEKLNALLPASVYFRGKTAPLQLRNAAGITFPDGQIVWLSLVDTSGYSTAVQEKYQFYLVTEGPLRFGSASLPAGAYGAGFLGDQFVIMDLGGHTVAQGATEADPALRRPRPLQLLSGQPASAKLYLGRRWVLLQPANDDRH